MSTQPPSLAALLEQGQSVWLDSITRELVQKGDLRKLIEGEGLRGMTSNPTIFQKAIGGSADYDAQIRSISAQSPNEIFDALAFVDIQGACDLFRPLYDATKGADGFVSIEVGPQLAHDTHGSIEEGRRLWKAVDRPNVMIKIPGTAEGAPAVKALLTEGINVNITLLFSLENHERVMHAYVEALEARAKEGKPIDRIASVASFFVSRVDTLVDKLLDQKGNKELQGKAAIANAKLAYENFRKLFGGERFAKLAAKGARLQRVLWASTSTKNKAYRDVLYVEELIGPDTINTLPLETIRAFQDHGKAARTIDRGVDDAKTTMTALKAAGIDYAAVTKQLEDEGVASFQKSFDELLAGVAEKAKKMR